MLFRNDSLSLIGLIWRNLYRQPLRTALTILGVSVGVIAIVALGTLVRGLWRSTEEAIHAGGIDLIVFQKGVSLDILSRLDELETRAALQAIPEIVEVTCGIAHVMPVANLHYVFVLGVSRDELNTRELNLAEGRSFEADDEVLIGSILAHELSVSAGEQIELRGRAFKIAGIYVSDVVFFNGGILMPLPSLQDLLGMDGYVGYFRVKVREGVDPAVVARRVERENPQVSAIAGVTEYKKVDLALEIADDFVFIISFVATIIGAIIVMNTMWMSVHERTREIGVLRAVGWSARKITGMIIIESAAIALIACAVGSLLGVALAQAAASLPYGRQFASPVLAPSTFALAIALAVVLGVAGGAAPAWRAARISPVEALRYE